MIILFELDNVLVKNNKIIKEDMMSMICELHDIHELGIISNVTVKQIQKQLGAMYDKFKYVFSECGTVVYIDKELVIKKNIRKFERPTLNMMLRQILFEISLLWIPMCGHIMEFKNGLVQIVPCGLQASKREMLEFKKFDVLHDTRKNIVNKIKNDVSFDEFIITSGDNLDILIYPKKWNKKCVMNYLLGDVCYVCDSIDKEDDNYDLCNHNRVKSVLVRSYEETIDMIKVHKLNEICDV